MSNFIVSARKYRPMRFDEVVGQDHVTNTLKNALRTDHLGHSFLFCGPRGVGKTTSARILAKVLNCENRTEDFEPCNSCSSCTAFNQNQSFNIYELDAASNNSVDNIRDLVDQVRFPPQQGEYKVYIIDEVHMLSQSAFNAFLKTLEEPPKYAIFILATTEKHKILPTILSRCQIFDFNRVQVDAIVEHLKMICKEESIVADETALHVIAQKADGALRDSLSIFDRIVSFSGETLTYQHVTEGLNLLDYETYFELTEHLLYQDRNKTLLLYDQILKNGFDGDQVMLGLGEHIRNLLVAKEPETAELLEVAPEVRQRFITQSQLASTSFLLNSLNVANTCDTQFKQAKNKRLHVELALLKICYLGQLKKNQSIADEAELVKKNTDPNLIAAEQDAAPVESDIPDSVTLAEEPTSVVNEDDEQFNEPEKMADELPNETIQTTENSLPENQDVKPVAEATTQLVEKPAVNSSAKTSKAETFRKTVEPALSFRLSKLNEEVSKRKEAEQADEQDAEEVDSDDEEIIVNSAEIEKAWYAVAEKVKSASLIKGIQDSTVVVEGNKLTVTVFGTVIRDYLKEHHNLIVETIQQETGLKKFTYEIDCTEIDKGDVKTFTKEEELEYIKSENPAIRKLCDDLNLEIKYD